MVVSKIRGVIKYFGVFRVFPNECNILSVPRDLKVMKNIFLPSAFNLSSILSGASIFLVNSYLDIRSSNEQFQ